MEGQKVHFIGIGGIGMSGLAQYLQHEGMVVRGTDSESSPVTELLTSQGIDVIIGPQVAENVAMDTDLVVYSDAVKETNPERMRAKELGIAELSYFGMLGHVSEGKRTIAVAGTHGKTTTTGMLTRILKDAGAMPSAIIGSIVADFGSNYVTGESNLFVVEACEYNRHFLNLTPHVLVVTNLEFDHTDYFTSLEDVQDAFRTLMERVPENGAIITDTENEHIIPLLEGLAAPIVHYPSELAYSLRVPGTFNQMNARAAAAAAKAIVPGLTDESIAHSLAEFRGAWRRFEYKGKTSRGVDVYDDYAHHPTAIRETLRALRAKTGGRAIVAFHPHLYSRTRDLLDGFARSFEDASEVLIAPIYAAREADDGSVSSELLADRIQKEGTTARAFATLDEVEAALRESGKEGDVIMTMGAGDIYRVADSLVATAAMAATTE
jgi:UDP-N-acetylmuramate--alanine ligase